METAADTPRAILARFLPAEAVGWVHAYVDNRRLHLRITPQRRSKLGDYRPPRPGHDRHAISVNGDLPPHLFLWVFLHEAAHLETHLTHPAAHPHGHVWQVNYAHLLNEHLGWFPPDIQPLIAAYASRIPLSHALGRRIETALRCIATDRDASPILDQQQPGTRFRLRERPDRLFVALERRRTRWLCRCLDDNRQFLVSGQAEIVPEC